MSSVEMLCQFKMSSRWIFFVVSGKKLQNISFSNLNLQFSARRVRKRARYRRRETKTGSDFNYCSKLNLSAGVEKSLETEKTCCKDKKLQICVSGKDNDLVTSVVKDLIEHL